MTATSWCRVTNGPTIFHDCTPEACELDDVYAIRAEVQFWRGLEKAGGSSFDAIVSDIERMLDVALDRQKNRAV